MVPVNWASGVHLSVSCIVFLGCTHKNLGATDALLFGTGSSIAKFVRHGKGLFIPLLSWAY